MIDFGSTEELYQCLKSTSVKGITFTVEPLYKADPHYESTTSKINNYNVMLRVAINSSDGKTYAAKLDFSGFDEAANRIMAKAVPLLIFLNKNTTLESLAFDLRVTHAKKKLGNFFITFCIEMLMRIITNNKKDLSSLLIHGANQYLLKKKGVFVAVVTQFIEKTPSLKNLALCGMKLVDDELEPILSLLKTNNIKLEDLDLSDNVLSSVAIEKVFNYLQDFKSLDSLILSGQDTEGKFIFNETLFKVLIATLKILPHPLKYLGLADLSIDDGAFQRLFTTPEIPEIVVEKINTFDLCDNELSNSMIVHAKKAFMGADSEIEFEFLCYDCSPVGVIGDFMWEDEQAIHEHLDKRTKGDLSDMDSNNNTPAHYLARSGRLEGLKRLKELGVKLDEENYFGFTPLHNAIRYSKKDVVDWLLQSVNASYLMQPSFLVALVLSDNSDMFNLLKIKLKKQFTKFLKLIYEGLTFAHQLAHQGASTLLAYVLENGFITKLQLEARYTSSQDKSMEHFSPLMIGLTAEDINKDKLFDFFNLMIHQKVEIRYVDIDRINAYTVKHPDNLSPEHILLHELTEIYHNLRIIFDTLWREYSLAFDTPKRSFIVNVSQANLREKFKVTNDFTLLVDSILKYIFEDDVDLTSMRVLEGNNAAQINIINQFVSTEISIDSLTQDILSLRQRPPKQKPKPRTKPKQHPRQSAENNSQEPKPEPQVVTPSPTEISIPTTSITHSLPTAQELVYESRNLYKQKPQKKSPSQSKQKSAHGQGKNSKNLKRQEQLNKRIAKEQRKNEREEKRLEKDAERIAKEQQKAEEARLAIEAERTAKEQQKAQETPLVKAPLQLREATQRFFSPGKINHNDEEKLFNTIVNELMKFNS